MNPSAWSKIKGIHIEQLVKALKKDGFEAVVTKSAIHTYRHPDGRVATIHWHPKKTFGPGLLKSILKDIGWSEEDMKRLKLIK